MELVTGAMSSILGKLGELLLDELFPQRRQVKNDIEHLHTKFEAVKAALQDISQVPANKLKEEDKIWARDCRELSYDIEDSIDTFIIMLCKGDKKGFIAKACDKLRQVMIHHRFAIELRNLNTRIEQLSQRRIRTDFIKPVTIDPRMMLHNMNARDLVGTGEAQDELIQLLMQGKIVSIVGCGGLGKTTLARLVYDKLKQQFDCSAFISVSQTPDMERLFNDMMYQLFKDNINASMNLKISKLNELLKEKRYEQIT